jgi:hypothetical protein
VAVNPFEANRAPALERYLSRTPVVTRPIAQMEAVTRRLLAEDKYDVVVASGATMEQYALSVPYEVFRALEEHNSLSRMMHDRYLAEQRRLRRVIRWISWQKMKRYERQLYGRFDLVTLVSEQDQAYAEWYVEV